MTLANAAHDLPIACSVNERSAWTRKATYVKDSCMVCTIGYSEFSGSLISKQNHFHTEIHATLDTPRKGSNNVPHIRMNEQIQRTLQEPVQQFANLMLDSIHNSYRPCAILFHFSFGRWYWTEGSLLERHILILYNNVIFTLDVAFILLFIVIIVLTI